MTRYFFISKQNLSFARRNNAMNQSTQFGTVSRALGLLLFISVLFYAPITQAEVTVSVTTDKLLCESEWVTLTATVDGCAPVAYEWFQFQVVDTDGTGTNTEAMWVPADGSEFYHKKVGDNLKTISDGDFKVIVTCEDGTQVEGNGQVQQQMNEALCGE